MIEGTAFPYVANHGNGAYVEMVLPHIGVSDHIEVEAEPRYSCPLLLRIVSQHSEGLYVQALVFFLIWVKTEGSVH